MKQITVIFIFLYIFIDSAIANVITFENGDRFIDHGFTTSMNDHVFANPYTECTLCGNRYGSESALQSGDYVAQNTGNTSSLGAISRIDNGLWDFSEFWVSGSVSQSNGIYLRAYDINGDLIYAENKLIGLYNVTDVSVSFSQIHTLKFASGYGTTFFDNFENPSFSS